MAKLYHARPSALLGLADSFRAFAIDRVVWTFGTAVESDMDKAEGQLSDKAKSSMKVLARQRVWDAYMGIDTTNTPGRFADPANAKRR